MLPTNVVYAKQIASSFSKELGFVNRAALTESESRQELEVIPDIGFAHFHHRKDGQTTIYELAVAKEYQKQGWGRLLFFRVLCAAIEKKQTKIVAKCPEDLSSNNFYLSQGFKLSAVELGRKRKLNKWEYTIQLPLLFYCGSAGASKYDQISIDAGWRHGIRSDKDGVIRCQMVDNEWHNYNHQKHLERVKEHKPLVATARDIESPEQLPKILAQAKELALYCGRVLLIPKCKVTLPAESWLAFSVPTKYGGTTIEPSWFGDRFVHLLGGSPNAQASYAKCMNVISLDANYAMNVARKCVSTWQGRQERKMSSCYDALKLSLENQKSYWHKEWSWQDEPLFAINRS